MTSTPPLGKYLASTDKKTRDKAIEKLSLFLSESKDALPKSEIDKLWKGIFYCFWMSDKPLVQQALATEIAELLLTITTPNASLAFLRGFWECIVREWNGIDRLRVDKYYMLIRRFVNSSFRLLIRAEWSESACAEYTDILTKDGGPLCPNDIRVPTSLAYHIADIYVQELDKALDNTQDPLPAPLAVLFGPFFTLAAQTPNPATYKRVQSAVMEPLLLNLGPGSYPTDGEIPESEGRRLRFAKNSCFTSVSEGRVDGSDLKRKLLRRIFEIGSESTTREANRRKLYAFWKENYDDSDET